MGVEVEGAATGYVASTQVLRPPVAHPQLRLYGTLNPALSQSTGLTRSKETATPPRTTKGP